MSNSKIPQSSQPAESKAKVLKSIKKGTKTLRDIPKNNNQTPTKASIRNSSKSSKSSSFKLGTKKKLRNKSIERKMKSNSRNSKNIKHNKIYLINNMMNKNLSRTSKKIIGLWSDVAREKRLILDIFGALWGSTDDSLPPNRDTTTTLLPKSTRMHRWYADDDYYLNGSIVDFKNKTFALLGNMYNETMTEPPQIIASHHTWLYMVFLCEYVTLIFVALALCLAIASMKCKDLV